jgi:hypothetical protein
MGTDCRRLTRQYTGLRHDILCSIKKKGGRTEPVQPLFDVLRQALVSRPTHTAIYHLRSTLSSKTHGSHIHPRMATIPDVDNVPGTVHLVDLEHTLLARHAGNGAGDIVLVPTPSDDPDDPLNWAPRRKLTATICTSL